MKKKYSGKLHPILSRIIIVFAIFFPYMHDFPFIYELFTHSRNWVAPRWTNPNSLLIAAEESLLIVLNWVSEEKFVAI